MRQLCYLSKKTRRVFPTKELALKDAEQYRKFNGMCAEIASIDIEIVYIYTKRNS